MLQCPHASSFGSSWWIWKGAACCTAWLTDMGSSGLFCWTLRAWRFGVTLPRGGFPPLVVNGLWVKPLFGWCGFGSLGGEVVVGNVEELDVSGIYCTIPPCSLREGRDGAVLWWESVNEEGLQAASEDIFRREHQPVFSLFISCCLLARCSVSPGESCCLFLLHMLNEGCECSFVARMKLFSVVLWKHLLLQIMMPPLLCPSVL